MGGGGSRAPQDLPSYTPGTFEYKEIKAKSAGYVWALFSAAMTRLV